ncbi:MAG: AAA family ATPase [Lewinellaceae bacterium]|nr:AAA family ATPase [Lewinellaceae bacterium]
MVVNSITLTNFQCYFGEVKFEFKAGLNLIIGDNGAGKSKLYDAFYWVLYDQVFDSLSREFKKTNQVKGSLVSDKAKALCEPGDMVKSQVEMVVYNPKREVEYTLTRSYRVSKNESGALHQDPESDFSILQRDKFNISRPMVNQAEIESLLKGILPDDVKPYMWFQGEQVDSLIDFKNNSTLTHAINVLSDIREFDFFVEVSVKAFEAAEKEYQRESRKFSSDKRKSEDLENKKLRVQRDIAQLEEEKKLTADNLAYAIEKKDQLLNKLDDAQRIKELNINEGNLKERLRELDERLVKKKAGINKSLISRNWILKGAGSFVDLFAEKYNDYLETKARQEAEHVAQKKAMDELYREFRLPVDVPEPIFVKQMLEKEHCFICDREAPKGSLAYQKILEILERSQSHKRKPKPEPITKYDFSKEFKTLYQNGLNLQGLINQADYEIRTAIGEIFELETKYKTTKDELEGLQKNIMEHMNASSVGSMASSVNIVNEFQSHHEAIVNYERKLERIEYGIDAKKKEGKSIDEALKNLSTGKISPILEEKIKVLEDFRDIAKSTRARVFNRLIMQLEEEANLHYYNMTAENKSVRGRIKLEKQVNGNYMPKNFDNEGRILTSINDSNIILIKLAVIMAIISAKKSSPAADLYPLITDAPTSKFGDNYAIGFCRVASQVYGQSIVISKDFYNKPDLQQRLFSEAGDKIGSVYLIEPSLSEEVQREHRDELEVQLTKIK